MRLPIGNFLRRATPEEEPSLEIRLLHEAERFRRLAALAWNEQTIYPKNEYVEGSSAGQCGVTNFGFGLWLSWAGIVRTSQMFFEEGKIVAANGSLVGPDHTWLRIDDIDDFFVYPDLSMRFDLAGDQFPGIDVPAVVQYDDYFYADPGTSSGNRVYVPDNVTHFPDYDVSLFKGRVDCFMDNVCSIATPGSCDQTMGKLI